MTAESKSITSIGAEIYNPHTMDGGNVPAPLDEDHVKIHLYKELEEQSQLLSESVQRVKSNIFNMTHLPRRNPKLFLQHTDQLLELCSKSNLTVDNARALVEAYKALDPTTISSYLKTPISSLRQLEMTKSSLEKARASFSSAEEVWKSEYSAPKTDEYSKERLADYVQNLTRSIEPIIDDILDTATLVRDKTFKFLASPRKDYPIGRKGEYEACKIYDSIKFSKPKYSAPKVDLELLDSCAADAIKSESFEKFRLLDLCADTINTAEALKDLINAFKKLCPKDKTGMELWNTSHDSIKSFLQKLVNAKAKIMKREGHV